MLSQIYEEIKDDIGYFVRLYILAKVAGMGVPRVNRLLMIANNDLPAVEIRYERLKREVDYPGSMRKKIQQEIFSK